MPEPSSCLGIGMVGAGMIGQLAHMANFRELPDCRLVALAELRPELGRQAAERFGIEALYDDHDALLADPRVDAVVVVTRRPATGAVVEAALTAGRHVLSEKPMAHTVEQAERLLAAVSPGRQYVVGYMKRHDDGVRAAKACLETLTASGELGAVQSVRSWCFQGDILADPSGFVMTAEERPEGLELWPVSPDWVPADREGHYADFLNVQIHILNLLRYLFGATPRVRHADLNRRSSGLIQFDFGAFDAVHHMAEVKGCPWEEGVEILFDRGRLAISLPPPLKRGRQAHAMLFRAGHPPLEVAPAQGSWAFQRQAAGFVASILENRTSIADGRDAAHDIALVEAVWSRALGMT